MDRPAILLIEDDPQIVDAVRGLLEADGFEVRACADGESGLQAAAAHPCDVVVLDRMLPRMDGMEVLARLRAAGCDKPVLVLSALGRSENRIEGLEQGADDYLGKPFEPGELLARVRALHRRAAAMAHSPILICGELELHVRARTVHRGGRHLALSPKEFELLKYLMHNAGAVVTREMLLREVWKLNFDPQTNVIDVNLGRLRRKLDDGGGEPCLETVRGVGYRLVMT